jgi:hypothetical protein
MALPNVGFVALELPALGVIRLVLKLDIVVAEGQAGVVVIVIKSGMTISGCSTVIK